MTPTLAGRWQTRLLLMSTIGVIVTLGIGFFSKNLLNPFVLLFYVTLFGLVWDIFYNYLQTFRWDRDWPPIFTLLTGIGEALLLWGLLQMTFIWQLIGLQTLPGVTPNVNLLPFAIHYFTIWFIAFVLALGPLKIIFLQWRFKGGQWVGGL
ncbi:MAG: hypothetical protein AAF485_28510 [Chloroflexota bacterium]